MLVLRIPLAKRSPASVSSIPLPNWALDPSSPAAATVDCSSLVQETLLDPPHLNLAAGLLKPTLLAASL